MSEKFNFSRIEDQREFENLPKKERESLLIKAQGEGVAINKPLEILREEYRQRLNIILNKQLTVENIETFAEDSLGETVQLTDDVLTQYRENPNIHKVSVLNAREQEDEAFKFFELPDIQEILQSIIEVRDKINSLKEYIHTNAKDIDKVITPSDTSLLSGGGEGGRWEQKKMFPRVLTLLYILEHDFDILPGDTHIIKGRVTPEMVRQTPYVRINIPEIGRIVYLCDEEGNVSYVFDTNKIKENSLIIDEIDVDSKRDKNSLIASYPGIGVRLKQTINWRSNIVAALGGHLSETIIDRTERISEFRREKKEFLSFEDFQREVKALYTGEGDVGVWYQQEYKNHPDWPPAPYRIYKDKGWKGFPELIGRENRLGKEFLPFEDFQQEVKDLYQGEDNVEKWYKEELKNHSNWPFKPYRTYKNKGWEGWSEIVGKENPKKKKFPSFEDFERGIKDLYKGEGDVHKWYRQEYKNHSDWPFKPERIYKNKGWKGWSELVGKENPLKKEWLSFEDFQQEVKALYSGEGDIKVWYNQEYKNHPNWPSHPEKIYKNNWESLPDIVGRKSHLDKEYPSFETFQQEIRSLYTGKGGVMKWYHDERKNHPNWPSHPRVIYKDKGWVGFSELVEKNS